MLKNTKGFTLMELTVVVLILTVLLSVSVPKYRSATKKAQVSSNLPLIKALQDDIINYYNLSGTLPDNLFQLSLNRAEFSNISQRSAKHNATNCTVTLANPGNGVTIDCGSGWSLVYTVKRSGAGYISDRRIFNISDGMESYKTIASSFKWREIDDHTFAIN